MSVWFRETLTADELRHDRVKTTEAARYTVTLPLPLSMYDMLAEYLHPTRWIGWACDTGTSGWEYPADPPRIDSAAALLAERARRAEERAVPPVPWPDPCLPTWTPSEPVTGHVGTQTPIRIEREPSPPSWARARR